MMRRVGPARRTIAGSGASAWLSVALVTLSCGSRPHAPEELPLAALRSLPAVHIPPAPVDAGSAPATPEVPSVRALSWGAFGEGDRIAELQGTSLGSLTLLAWVTYVDPSPPAVVDKPGRGATIRGPGHADARTATVLVRVIDRDGEGLGPAKMISSKAVALGGVSLASNATREKVTLGWTGQEAGRAQVFLTELDRNGDKIVQRMLTRGLRDCSDVSLAAIDDGFLVAWVEQQGAAAEVHAARVGRDLVRTGEPHKIADAGGDASQVRLVVRGEETMLVWSEVRVGTDTQSGIFGVRLATNTLTPKGDVMRLFPAEHAQSLRAARGRDGWVLAWLDGPAAGAPGTHHAAIASIGKSRPREPLRFELPADLTSLAVDCEMSCRVVAAGLRGQSVEVYAWSQLAEGGWSMPHAIGVVAGTSGEDMSPVLLGDSLFFAEDDLHGKGRIAKSRLFWP